jgi:hypothetical protein
MPVARPQFRAARKQERTTMTKTQARALASAINLEYPDVQAVAIDLQQDLWGLRMFHNRLGISSP